MARTFLVRSAITPKGLLCAALLLTSCASAEPRVSSTFVELQSAASAHQALLTLPDYERSPLQVQTTVDEVLTGADRAFDRIAGQEASVVSFSSTIAALDDAIYPVSTVLNRMWLMKETQQEEAMRVACTEAVGRINEWLVATAYRQDLYQICNAFLERYNRGDAPKLAGEDHRLLLETMRDFRRDGLHLDAATQESVADLKNRLNGLETEFDSNITNTQVAVSFSAEELEGVPASFLEASRTTSGQHRVRSHVTSDYLAVMENAAREDTRKRLNGVRYNLAAEENGPLLKEMVAVRNQIAELLGYASWADYQTEPKMAGSGARAVSFVEDLVAGLEPKFRAEVEQLRQLKVADSGDENAVIHFWDFRYYQNRFMKERYGVDSEALRVYFPLRQVLDGMFAVYQGIFGLEFIRFDPGYKWVDDLEAYVVQDAASGEPLGVFYLDNFPRPGKYNHFAQFDIIGGKQLNDGSYQRPVVSLVCNFTPAVGDDPPLMSHYEVETIFHEFGHAMHSILTRARYGRYAGANVARDFVEAPSQMFENWVWDAGVLQDFAADYRDPSRKIPADLIARMKEADLATQGIHYRRQLSLALSDLRLHIGGAPDPQQVVNDTTAEVFFAPAEGSHFAAYWGHLTGYDAGYYGYAWADAIAADMATAFQTAPDGYYDSEVGGRLRRQIYQVGGSVDPGEAVSRFLQREPSNAAFLRSLGIQ